MELLKGRDLRQLRQEGWRATPAQAALIVRRVADALAFAHSKGVIHRDIKPANIFMVGRTQPRVLDFGIARVTHQRDSGQAMNGAGSPYYMSPEQVRKEPGDRRTDVFSLGVVLYELLTDTKPFDGESLRSDHRRRARSRAAARQQARQGGSEGARRDRRQGHGQGPGAALPLGALVRPRAAPVAGREPGRARGRRPWARRSRLRRSRRRAAAPPGSPSPRRWR
jgi:serine/threonine protein kinase